MKKFLLATFVGTAALLVLLYVQGRERLRREARLFDQLCPEAPPADEPPAAT